MYACSWSDFASRSGTTISLCLGDIIFLSMACNLVVLSSSVLFWVSMALLMLSLFFIDWLKWREVGPWWDFNSLIGDFVIGTSSLFPSFSNSYLTESYSVYWFPMVAFLECLALICLGFFFTSSFLLNSPLLSSLSWGMLFAGSDSIYFSGSSCSTLTLKDFSSFSRFSLSSRCIFYKIRKL